ncbi:CbaC protein [Natrinema gelatinilyticum]|uniref:CbaC protein n=1 Tax=Natrinema gelatinilyticum TaxID=2961571 RepID=UPI0020C285CC|nr:CbaC protein [Natrinema gelatinilyticum]
MRTTPAKLLILSAFVLVILVEARTVLAFFGIELTPLETVLIGSGVIGALLIWAVWPIGSDPSD